MSRRKREHPPASQTIAAPNTDSGTLYVLLVIDRGTKVMLPPGTNAQNASDLELLRGMLAVTDESINRQLIAEAEARGAAKAQQPANGRETVR